MRTQPKLGAKQIREGKRAAERFVFVLNQIDKLNPEEDMSSAKDEVQRELSRPQDTEIENVAIFPTSAKLSLLAQPPRPEGLFRNEIGRLNYLKGILSEPELDLRGSLLRAFKSKSSVNMTRQTNGGSCSWPPVSLFRAY